MSELQIFYEKTTQISHIFNNLQVTCADTKELSTRFFEQSNLQDIYSLAPENLISLLDQMKDAKPDQEEIIKEKLQSLNSLERNCVYAMMDVVVKIGFLENSSDLETRKHWFNIVAQFK